MRQCMKEVYRQQTGEYNEEHLGEEENNLKIENKVLAFRRKLTSMQDASRLEPEVHMPSRGDQPVLGRTVGDQKRMLLDPLLASQMQLIANMPLDNLLFVLHNQFP